MGKRASKLGPRGQPPLHACCFPTRNTFFVASILHSRKFPCIVSTHPHLLHTRTSLLSTHLHVLIPPLHTSSLSTYPHTPHPHTLSHSTHPPTFTFHTPLHSHPPHTHTQHILPPSHSPHTLTLNTSSHPHTLYNSLGVQQRMAISQQTKPVNLHFIFERGHMSHLAMRVT